MADQFTLQHGGSDQFLEQWGIIPQPAIPFPTPDDNGKVLGVSNGQWAVVSGGGGGSVEPLIVTLTNLPEGETYFSYGTLSETFSDIKSAFESGIPIYLSHTVEYTDPEGASYGIYAPLSYVSFYNENDYTYYYVAFHTNEGDMQYATDSEDGYPAGADSQPDNP